MDSISPVWKVPPSSTGPEVLGSAYLMAVCARLASKVPNWGSSRVRSQGDATDPCIPCPPPPEKMGSDLKLYFKQNMCICKTYIVTQDRPHHMPTPCGAQRCLLAPAIWLPEWPSVVAQWLWGGWPRGQSHSAGAYVASPSPRPLVHRQTRGRFQPPPVLLEASGKGSWQCLQRIGLGVGGLTVTGRPRTSSDILSHRTGWPSPPS